MKIILALACCLVLCSCTTWRENLIGVEGVSYPPEQIRYLRVALISEDREPTPEFVDAVIKSFQNLRRQVGIDIGAKTYYQVSLDGARTMLQIHRRLREWYNGIDQRSFDIAILYTHKFLAEDAAGIVMTILGFPAFIISSSEVAKGVFAVVRNLGTIEHEVAHLFCARDGATDEENRKTVLENKWRKYGVGEFGVCKNASDSNDPHAPFGDKYPEVVERAKARARAFAEKRAKEKGGT